jgi:DNA-binding CsgD family transcriptional regulator
MADEHGGDRTAGEFRRHRRTRSRRLGAALPEVLLFTGRPEDAERAVEAAAAHAAVRTKRLDSARAVHLLALSALDVERARALANRTLTVVEHPTGDAVVMAASVLSHVDAEAGFGRQGLRRAQAAVENIGPDTAPACRQFARLTLADRLTERHDFAAAGALIERAGTDEGRLGWPVRSIWCAAARAELLLRSGWLLDAQRLGETAIGQCAHVGAELFAPMIVAGLLKAALRIGNLLDATSLTRVVSSRPASGGLAYWVPRPDWSVLMLVAEQEGSRAALSWLSTRCAHLLDEPGLVVDEPAAPAWLVRVARSAGDRRLVEGAVALAERAHADEPESAALAAGLTHAGGLAEGDPTALALAVERHRDPWSAARASEDLGILIAEDGADERAVRQLDAALARFEAIGAVHDAARVRMRLRRMGRRPARPAVERAGDPNAHGWESLSVTEQNIAYLAGNGLTNQQIATRVFLSPHTVNYHLRRIFQNFGIASRVQLAQLTRARIAGPEAGEWSA